MEQWQKDLNDHFTLKKKIKKERKEQHEAVTRKARQFIKNKAEPAFEDLKDELKRYKRDSEIDTKKDWAALVVRHNKKKEFVYEITLISEGENLHANRRSYLPNEKGKLKLVLESNLHASGRTDRLEKIEREDIIADFLESYKQAARAR